MSPRKCAPNTVRRWLPRATAHSRRARHTRTPTPTPGDGTNTGLQHTTPTTGPYYQGPARPTDWHRARKKGADWLERAQLTACVSLLAVARRFACCAPPTSTRSLETKLRTDRVALATFAAGTYRESASAPPNNENSTVPPHHRNTTHSLNKPTHTGCVGPAAAKYCLLITSCGPPTAITPGTSPSNKILAGHSPVQTRPDATTRTSP